MRAAVERLPEGYARVRQIDLMKNKRELVIVTALSAILPAIMIVVMALTVPIRPALEIFFDKPWAAFALAAAMFAYIVLHELVHGLFIHIFSGKKAKYGFSWAYAYAASDFYFAKKPYLVIAMAPVVVWGCVFAALQALAPGGWAWWAFLLQVVNISGAAGDFYTTYVVARMPADVYTHDTGTAMEIFGKNGK